jgi:hypothetical protein
MEQQVEQRPNEPPKNRGWFQRGDRRINREGRPKGSKAGSEEGSAPTDRAPWADRLMLLLLRGRDLAFRLGHDKAPWIVNLPVDCEIVACRMDVSGESVALVIRSQTFPRIARGALIPEFKPAYNGLRWRRD